MQSRIGSTSSGRVSSVNIRGQTPKSNPFCPRSSSKVAQSIIKDHMVSHYKRVYSAKAAVDNSVPKSMMLNVKYNDRLRQERLKKGLRSQSSHSSSQRNSRASCSTAQSHYSSRSSVVSTPRLNTSFNVKDIVYISHNTSSQHLHRPTTSLKHHSPEASLTRKHSACSLTEQSTYKSFQDPRQKTYGGDLIKKHSQYFTQPKPFAPSTLKSEKSSFLSKYRYYRAPQRSLAFNSIRAMKQGEEDPESTKMMEDIQTYYDFTQEFNVGHERSEDEPCTARFSGKRVKMRGHAQLFDSSFRASETTGESYMMSVSAEEEELRYLEFISAVTDDILSRGSTSDRVLDRVMTRHIEMNRDQLSVGKMRHLLDILRKELQDPYVSTSFNSEIESGLSESLLRPLESQEFRRTKTKGDSVYFTEEYCDSQNGGAFLSSSKETSSPQASCVTDEHGQTEDETSACLAQSEKGSVSEGIKEDAQLDNIASEENSPDHSAGSEEDSSQNDSVANEGDSQDDDLKVNDVENEGSRPDSASVRNEDEDQECTSASREESVHQEEDDPEDHSQELDDLDRTFSKCLQVTSNNLCDGPDLAVDQATDTVASLSDDDF
ncbi:spermatogenesis-associated protein 7 homolog isoform X1 [Synchiropus splendidus]|uniref:spermatogenesis-associated protein 7 homolog isoform X1 n=1 Tax=Synchiropus splendidus TaxID=270530 RepID=UPI00237E9592|nr:spermatogenesis-associated protein 7 homolog isoform X1 [Synchiropus splendidus]